MLFHSISDGGSLSAESGNPQGAEPKAYKKVQEFLDKVNEQIHYRPMQAAIDEELRGHIEDKAELYKGYGVEEEEAVCRAVRDMGDAVEIGIQMNAAHHTRVFWPLMGMALFFVLLGILGNIRYYWGGHLDSWFFTDISEGSLYFAMGLVVLLLVMCYGYPLLVRYVRKICICYLVFCGFVLFMRFGYGFFYDRLGGIRFIGSRFFSITVCFGLLVLAAPVLAVFLYRQRHKGVRGILYAGLFTAVLLMLQNIRMFGSYLYMASLALMLTFLGVLLYMAFRGYMDLPVKKAAGISTAVFLALLLLSGISRGAGLGRSMELFLTPERQAANIWDDGYNGVLVKELLGKARLVGQIELSQEELYAYGTGKWYFREGGLSQWADQMSMEETEAYLNQFYQVDTVTLEDILPQHYQNNYRITYWILKYGWLPGFLLIGAIAVFCGMLLWAVFHIRNRLGRLAAFAGSICLIIQYVFYLMGDFGYQFGWFGTLPFLSEGLTSISVNACLLGLVLSAYRYDLVMEEKMDV